MTDPAGPAARDQVLKEFLAIHDVACPRCGYNLRASESARCPECSAALDLRVGSPDLRLVPWITAIVGTSIPAGFTAVFSVLTILTAFIDGFSTAGERNTVVFCWIVTAVLGTLIVAFARRRSAFLRNDDRGRVRTRPARFRAVRGRVGGYYRSGNRCGLCRRRHQKPAEGSAMNNENVIAFDADDTLWHTEKHFQEVQRKHRKLAGIDPFG